MRRTTYTKRTGTNSKNGWRHKSLAVPVAAVVIIAAVLAGLEATDTTHLFHSPSTPPVIPSTTPANQSANQPDKPANSDSSGQNTAPAPRKTPAKNSASDTEGLPLYMPYGAFISNHRPGQDGSPTSETSVCNTTPGATCYISFSNGTITTKLPAQKTNSSGVTYWYWDVNKAHLGAGSWQVTAVASLGGQTKKTKDPQPLTIE